MKYSLKELRARKCLTQADMASKLGISRQRYITIEKNPENVRCKTLLRVAAELDVDIGEIFLPHNHTNSEATSERR